MAFHEGLYCLLKQKSAGTEINIMLKFKYATPLNIIWATQDLLYQTRLRRKNPSVR